MKVSILSIFPEMIESALNYSMVRRARDKGLLDVECIDIRDFAKGRHRVVDDYQYGGGVGMLMKPEPLIDAVESVIQREKSNLQNYHESDSSPQQMNKLSFAVKTKYAKIIMTSPQGVIFNQDIAENLSKEEKRIIFICGHYEGIDERVITILADSADIEFEEISLGDYILTGGELAALVMLDASIRLVNGVLGNKQSVHEETFTSGMLDYPKYTRPANFRGLDVPEVLLSGNHKNIEQWRKEMSITNTKRKRPDLSK